MNEQVFRKKSLDKVKSPENLNDYVQVSNPGVWLLLAAIIVLLAGAVIWGVFGHIETTVEVKAAAADGVITCEAEDIEPGMILRIGDAEYEITAVDGDRVTAKADIADGDYSAQIVTESIAPLSFVLN